MKVQVLCYCGHPAKRHTKANVAIPRLTFAGCRDCKCQACREDFTHAVRLAFHKDHVWFREGFWGRPKAFVMVIPRGVPSAKEAGVKHD